MAIIYGSFRLRKEGVFLVIPQINMESFNVNIGVTRTCRTCGTHKEDGICVKCARTPN